MKLMKKDIKPNQLINTYFILDAMDKRKSKDNQYYLCLSLSDGSGKIKGYIWNEISHVENILKVNSFVKIRGFSKMINNSLIIHIENINMADKNEIDLSDFLQIVPGGIEYWKRLLLEQLDTVTDFNCKRLISLFIEDKTIMDAFYLAPAGISIHHNYIGGLLQHTVNVMSTCSHIADNYKGLINRDLLILGAFLHDIGKIKEYSLGLLRNFTKEGRLIGHIGIGLLILQEKISKLDYFPENLAMELKHMILSHHGDLQYGSCVRPSFPEAVALNLADTSDARLNHLDCHLSNSDLNQQWSPYDRILNTHILIDRYVSNQYIKEAA